MRKRERTSTADGNGRGRADFDGIPECGAGAMHLQGSPVSWRHISVRQRRPDHLQA